MWRGRQPPRGGAPPEPGHRIRFEIEIGEARAKIRLPDVKAGASVDGATEREHRAPVHHESNLGSSPFADLASCN
jgi:hypothetical protein